eukprot:gene5394-7477_t
MVEQSNVICLNPTFHCVSHLFTKIRAKETTNEEFKKYSRRLMSLICEEGLSYVGESPITVITPTGCEYAGSVVDPKQMVAISIIRAGDAMLDVFMRIAPEVSVGKILIQRNEETAQPMLFYSKLPKNIQGKNIILLDPMLATGGSAKEALRVLIENGALEENISFFTVVSCPEGIANVLNDYPRIRIITGEIDQGLNEKAYIIPGLGDYGDRFFGSDN